MSICVAVFEIGRLVYKLVHSFVYSFIASCPDQCLLSVNTPCVLLPSFVLFFFDFFYGLSSHTFVSESKHLYQVFISFSSAPECVILLIRVSITHLLCARLGAHLLLFMSKNEMGAREMAQWTRGVVTRTPVQVPSTHLNKTGMVT